MPLSGGDHVLPGVRHIPHREAPNAVLPAIADFLVRLEVR